MSWQRQSRSCGLRGSGCSVREQLATQQCSDCGAAGHDPAVLLTVLQPAVHQESVLVADTLQLSVSQLLSKAGCISVVDARQC